MKKVLLSLATAVVAFGASAEEVFIAGGFNAWSTTANQLELKDGVYTTTIEKLTPEFKIILDGAWLGSETPLTLGEALPLGDTGMGGNIVFADPEIKVVDNAVVTFDVATKAVTVTGEQGDADITYAIHGNFYTESASDWQSKDMTLAEGVWSINFTGLNEATGEFGIKELTAGAQTAWYSSPAADAFTVTGDFTGVLVTADATNVKVDKLTGDWTFSFNAATKELKVAPYVNSIEGIEAEGDAAAVYYNMQGVRVSNPENGMFICVRGSEVSKVLVK